MVPVPETVTFDVMRAPVRVTLCVMGATSTVAVGVGVAAGVGVTLFDAGEPGAVERAEHLGAEILELCVAVGGTVTGEHGVGVEKLGPMCTQFGSGELEAFHAVKRAFDPDGLLNPGKAVPTLARCADYGAMRVHGGKQPFSHLPRF